MANVAGLLLTLATFHPLRLGLLKTRVKLLVKLPVLQYLDALYKQHTISMYGHINTKRLFSNNALLLLFFVNAGLVFGVPPVSEVNRRGADDGPLGSTFIGDDHCSSVNASAS